MSLYPARAQFADPNLRRIIAEVDRITQKRYPTSWEEEELCRLRRELRWWSEIKREDDKFLKDVGILNTGWPDED